MVVPYPAVEQIGQDYGKALAAKPLVVDVSNPSAGRDGEALAKWVDEQGGAGLATAKWLPGARLVRAWNALGHDGIHGADILTKPRWGQPDGVPIAGDDPQAVALATKLFKEAHFEPVLIGGLAKGKYLISGSPISGEHTPDELRKIAASLK